MVRALCRATVLVALGGGAARAGEVEDAARPTLAILTVDTSSAELARSFEGELETRLAPRVRLIPRGRVREQLRTSTKWIEGCVVGRCLSELRAQTGAGVALLAALTGSGTTFGYVVTLIRTDTGRVLAQDSDRCDVCTESEAQSRALLATLKLVVAIPARLPDDTDAGAAASVPALSANPPLAAERRSARRVGWTLTLVGLTVAAGGTVLYLAADGRPAFGLAAAAAGGGAAVGGLTVLAF
jgi:hypothetical protein